MRSAKISKLYEYGDAIEIEFVVLDRSHRELAKRFKCGNVYIDWFIHTIACKDKETVTYAAIDVKNELIISIMTLVASGIYTNPSKLSMREKIVIPAIEIRNFATDVRYQKLSYSNDYNDNTLSYQIFNKYMKDILEMSKNVIGIKKVILYSVDKAIPFYKKSRFKDFKKFMVRSDARSIRGCTPMYFNLN